MCGRFYIDPEMYDEVQQVIKDLSKRYKEEKEASKKKDIYPTNTSLILYNKDGKLSDDFVKWGFPKFNHKGIFINARSETVTEKRTFRDSILKRRCVIPARGFYEWDSDKNKESFFKENKKVIYMAGFFKRFEDETRFMILTTAPNESVASIHDRMPLILEEREIENWVFDDNMIEFLLEKEPLPLAHQRES